MSAKLWQKLKSIMYNGTDKNQNKAVHIIKYTWVNSDLCWCMCCSVVGSTYFGSVATILTLVHFNFFFKK